MRICSSFFKLSLISLATNVAFAATPIDLSKHTGPLLKSAALFDTKQFNLKETSRRTDFNETTHVRFQQQYNGHDVWGADGIAHVPSTQPAALNRLTAKTSMNGMVYANLAEDLATSPTKFLNTDQEQKALQHAKQLFSAKHGITKFEDSKTETKLIVYIDKQNKAHWAYLVSFVASEKNKGLALPTYILDAISFNVYEEWNNLQTLDDTFAGGFGGNPKSGKIIYDGTTGNFPSLKIQRDPKSKVCKLENADVSVRDDTNAWGPINWSPVEKFDCKATDPLHGNVYWSGEQDATNEGFSPANDALYIGQVVKDMYQNWYQQPILTMFGYPIKLVMHVHAKDLMGQKMDNAFYLPLTMSMYFGDGVDYFYPLTSIGVGAHELSHAFTSKHSNLTYEKQSGGLNESFSDMAAQAAEYYSTGKNSWQIGPEIVKGDGALRYMDDPTKDGASIGHVKDYSDDLNVHYSSGIFNKVFYTLGTTEGWDTRKAFDVMVKANMDYWTSSSSFDQAACGVMKATRDYKYDTTAVAHAMSVVGLDVSSC